MGRSVWKGPFLKLEILKRSLISKKSGLKKVFRTYARNSVITPLMVGLVLRLHDGRNFIRLVIEKGLVGYKLGELVRTRSDFEYKKKKKKKGK